jgi:hypothetical protein
MRLIALLAVASLTLGSLAEAQCNVVAPSTCLITGFGHKPFPRGPGSLTSTVTLSAAPSPLQFSFEAAPGTVGIVLVSLTNPGIEAIGLEPGGSCARTFIWPGLDFFFVAVPTGPNTRGLEVDLGALRGTGFPVQLQGFALDSVTGCPRATDGYFVSL